MNKTPQNQSQKKRNNESLLAVLLVLLVFFLGVLIATLFSGALQRQPVDTTQPTTSTTGGGSENEDPGIDPSLYNPVFSGGVVPTTLPIANDQTVELGSEIYSQYAVLIDVQSNTVLAGKGADTQMSPASMTKVMTLIVACEKLTQYDLTQRMTLNEYYNNYNYNGLDVGLIDGTKYLGDTFYIKDLLYGVGMASAADCVLMIAERTYGTMDAFVAAMNEKARVLGLTQTYFVDASGDELGNVTTAKEMAVIMAYAMQCPLICEILGEDEHVYSGYWIKDGVDTAYNRQFSSHLLSKTNQSSRLKRYEDKYGAFVLATCKDLIGKTGYLDKPDRSYLVCSVTGRVSGHTYVAVVGENTGTDIFANTLRDAKILFDTYAK